MRRMTLKGKAVALILILSILSALIITAPTIVSAEAYIPIYTTEDLANISENLSGSYILMNDIDLSEYNDGVWSPMGTADNPFTGVLEGNGYTISNMKISAEVKGVINAGLFVKISGGEVKNLFIENATISMLSDEKVFQRNPSCVGLLAAQADNVKVINCNTSGEVNIKGKGSTTQSGRVTICAGGLIGRSSVVEFYECGNLTNITAHAFDWGSASYAGGITGYADSNSLFMRCNNSGIIVATGDITDSFGGGIVGWADNTDVKKCINSGNIMGGCSNSFPPFSASAGGICGFLSNGQIEMSYNIGLIESTYEPGSVYNGGIVGRGEKIYVTECYNKADVDSYTSDYEGDTSYVGGVIGYSNGINIENVYVIGTVGFRGKYDNGGRLGGIIGRSDGESTIVNAYGIVAFDRYVSSVVGAVIGVTSDAYLNNIYVVNSNINFVGSGGYEGENILKVPKTDLTKKSLLRDLILKKYG